ncbi:MAG: OmpA family protein [Saprospiraceae bacterium]|nr:OmpA family protein [Saprospiraceae bacterium]
MTLLTIFIIFVLFAIVIVQISRINEMAKSIRGEEDASESSMARQGNYLMLFMVLFLVGTVASAYAYKNYMLGYGPHQAASEHGGLLDNLFNVTLVITGIVFIITHIALFYYAWKYRMRKGRTASFIAHDNKLEIIWSIIPAFVMTGLVISGLLAWGKVMADVEPDEDYIEIEATGTQFQWFIRYPGEDGQLGTKNFRLINSANTLGQDWSDVKNLDDFIAQDIYLPRGKKVRVRINAMDVLHNFYLPHFRVKMDAVPGLPTVFVFTPMKTTEEYREELSKYPEYQVPADPTDPDGPLKWEAFDYELACAELCGKGHYSMRKLVKVVEEDEYRAWLRQQESFYVQSIRGTDEDPYVGQLFDYELKERKQEFDDSWTTALESETDRIVRLKYVNFETASATLTPLSRYELDNVVEAMEADPAVMIELSGHTDSQGDDEANQELSQRRADAVLNYLTGQGIGSNRLSARGYGETQPIDDNGTPEGRANNRRTEVKIISN